MLSQAIVCIDQALVYIPMIIGAFISISLKKIPDLSLESAFTAGAIAAYHVLKLNLDTSQYFLLPLVVGASFIGGMVVGVVSSILTSYCKFPH